METVLLEYQSRLHGLQQGFAAAQGRQSTALAIIAATLLLAILLWTTLSARRIALVPIAASALSLRRFFESRRDASRLARLCHFYRSGLDRLNGEWLGKGISGEEFCPDHHLYARDLNLFGRGSMFELLCTACTQVGRRRLASYLVDLPDRRETTARQEAVSELAPQRDLRERVWLLGTYSFQQCEWEPFREWLASPPFTDSLSGIGPRIVPRAMLALSAAIALMVLVPWLAPVGAGMWTRVVPFLLPALCAQAALAIWLRRGVRPSIEATRRLGQDLTLLRAGLAVIEAQSFRCTKLRELSAKVKGASHAVRKLERLVHAVEQCNKEWFYAISRVLLIDTQLALGIEKWKARHNCDLAAWLDGWGEFEALCALACYAHEHPADVFPEIVDAPGFEATGLAHPLLHESVRNDICVGEGRRFYLLSGSNMSGKSTLLRAIGLNAVLGSAGAPVRAHRVRQGCLAVCASISITDSPVEGKSKFKAEIDRLREILSAAAGPKPVLFAIDEILSGTNSRDRRVAAEAFLRALIGAGAMGALSTHDLALTEIAEEPALNGCNVHMESRDPDDPLSFDYRLKPGVCRQSNALAIARMAGVVV